MADSLPIAVAMPFLPCKSLKALRNGIDNSLLAYWSGNVIRNSNYSVLVIGVTMKVECRVCGMEDWLYCDCYYLHGGDGGLGDMKVEVSA